MSYMATDFNCVTNIYHFVCNIWLLALDFLGCLRRLPAPDSLRDIHPPKDQMKERFLVVTSDAWWLDGSAYEPHVRDTSGSARRLCLRKTPAPEKSALQSVACAESLRQVLRRYDRLKDVQYLMVAVPFRTQANLIS